MAGLLGMKPDDPRLPDSFALAREAGLDFAIHPVELRSAHPNTAVLALEGPTRRLNLSAASVGGGRIRVTSIDGVAADFGGDANTLIIHNDDTPAASLRWRWRWPGGRSTWPPCRCFRSAPGGEAVMVLECDSHIPAPLEFQLTAVPGIRKVTCLNVDDEA